MAAAREDDAASKLKAEEYSSAEEAEHQKAEETVARSAAADANGYSDDDEDYDDDPVIRNLNQISRRNLMPPEWIEHRRKRHYEHQALLDSIYHALQNGEIESDSDDDDDGAAAAERSKQLWAGVDLSGLNVCDGEYAIAVYPDCVSQSKSQSCPEEEEDHDAAPESRS